MSRSLTPLGESVHLPTDEAEKIKIAILAGGNFGTAIATVAARKGHDVVIFTILEDQARSINETHINNECLSDFTLPNNIRATTSLTEALDGCGLIIACLPAQLTPGFFKEHKSLFPGNVTILNTAKGLYLPTKQLLHEPVLEVLGRDHPYAVLSGPSFAQEIMQSQPTAVVVACPQLYRAVAIQRALSSESFRIYTSQDIIGVQLGGALKNPLAIGAGYVQGSGYGINTLSAFVTRSSSELQRLCVAMGGKPETISGLAGIGDLMLTCFGSSLSRNCKTGIALAKGESLDKILSDGRTVEGIPTAEVAVYYAEMCSLDLPIFQAVHHALKGTMPLENLPNFLMNRPLRSETS